MSDKSFINSIFTQYCPVGFTHIVFLDEDTVKFLNEQIKLGNSEVVINHLSKCNHQTREAYFDRLENPTEEIINWRRVVEL